MKNFCAPAKAGRGSEIQTRFKKQYIEIEVPCQHDYSMSYFLYYIPTDADSGLIITCWDQSWSDLGPLLNHMPALVKTIENAQANYRWKSRMLYLDDPKDGVRKWMLVREVDVDNESGNIMADPDFQEGMEKVFKKSQELLAELLAMRNVQASAGYR